MQTRGKPGLSGAEHDAMLAQLYRGELSRSDKWRTRLDTTTNWALTTTAAVVSFAFGSASTTHVTLLAGIWMVMTFLVVEARRYRYYDLWNRRVRLLEGGYWVPLIRREPIDQDSLRELAVELERPQIQLSFMSALQVRLNRTYGSVLLVLFLSWFVKVYSHPGPARSLEVFLLRAHIGPIPGWLVTIVLLTVTLAFIALFCVSLFARAPMGELRPRPRPRALSMWELFYRPYAATQSRRRTPRPMNRSEPRREARDEQAIQGD
jgi:uncharacterized membrane protein